MKSEAEVVRKIRQWVTYAEEDLRPAQHAMRMVVPCPYRLVAYRAQQCAEKYLKGFLVAQGIDFPRTHNISVLLELADPKTGWLGSLAEAEQLTPYAVMTRYPGEEEPVTQTEASEAIQIAEVV